MSRILRFFVCLGTLFFASNALAAGYSCSSLPKYLSCQHGYYMTSSQSSTTYNGTPKVGNYCQPCSRMGSNYTCAGGTAAPVQAAGGYTCPTYMKYTSCSVGYYMTDSSTSTVPDGTPKVRNACRPCSVYGANYTCAGGTAAPQAIKINVTCPKGQYLPQGATSCTTCPVGSFCPGQTCNGVSLVTGATSACGLSSCSTSTGALYPNSASGSSSINDCYLTLSTTKMVGVVNGGMVDCAAGYYCVNGGRNIYYDSNNEERGLTDSRPTIGGGEACARGSISGSTGWDICRPCPNGTTSPGTGTSSPSGCNITCSNSANVKTWVTPIWTPNYVSNSCKIESCVACTKGTGVASCSASIENNICTYTATCASGYKNPTCNGSSCSCEVGSYTITLNATANGGTGGMSAVYEVPSVGWYSNAALTTSISSVTMPTKANSVFNGYYSAQSGGTRYITNAGALPSNTTFSANTTLYAQYSAASCNVTNGSATMSISGNKVSCAVTCNTGYSQSGGTNATTSFTVTGAVGAASVSASCSPRTFTVSLMNYDGTSTHSTIYEKYATGWYSNSAATTTLSKATVPTRAGYLFRGFYTAKQSDVSANGGSGTRRITADGTLPANTTFTANTSLYAAWAKDCTAPLENGSCTATIGDDGSVSYITSCNTGYTLSGANTANPKCTPKIYTITLNATAGGGTGGTSTIYLKYATGWYSDAAATNAITSITMPTKTNSICEGYFFDETFGSDRFIGRAGNIIASNTAFTANTTWYAHYEEASCNITNGSGTVDYIRDNAVTCYVTCNTGYSRYGGTDTITSFSKGGSAGYGWVPGQCFARTSTVSFDANGGTGGQSANVTAKYDSAMPSISTTAPTRTGYTFMGWYDNATYTSGTQYYTAAGASARTWNKVADATLYAGWKANSYTCTAGQYLKAGATSCSSCEAGHACAGGTYSYNASSAQGRVDCMGRTQFSAAGAAKCSTVSTGYYTTGCNSSNNNCTGQSQCTSGTWCASGVQKQCSSLSGVSVTGGTYTSAAGSSANTACKYTAPSKTITGCKTVTTNTVTYSGTAWPATTYGVTANGGYIISGNNTAAATCSQCGTAKYSAGGTATSCSSCPNADSGWTATSPAGSTAYTACYEYQTPVNCASGSVKRAASSATAYSSTISLLSTLKSKAGYYASTTATSCTICPAGSSCAASATAPTTCANWTYAASTGMSSCTACPALTSGWTKNDSTGTGWKSHTSCVQISPKPANCAGGNLKQVAASNGATTWGASTVNSALSSEPGYYINGTACSPCTGATYYGGGTATSCTPCPSIYTSDTTAAKSKAEQCAVQTTAGKYIATAKATEQTKCPAKNYCPSASVKYGATNSPTACPTADATTARTTYPDDYLNPTRLSINNQGWSTGLPAITSCSANYSFTNAAGNFSVESVGYNATTGKYENGGGKYYTLVNAGWYLVDKYSETYCNTSTNRMYYHNVAECTANSYCPGYKSMPLCSTGTHNDEMGRFACSDLGNGYNYSPAKSGAETACYLTTSNSKFVAAAGAAEGACTAGGWCPGGVRVNYGSTGGRNTCPTKYPSSSASSNSELDCYVTTAAGKYVATVGAGQVNCAGTGYYCPGGTNVYSGAYGSRLTTGGRTQCPAGYRDLVATASTTKEAQCTMNVAGGKYVKVAKESAASGTCAAGYAKAAHSVTYGNTSSCAACTGTTYAENTGQASCTACPTQSGVTNISYWISTGTHTDAKGCYGFYNDVALNNGSVARIQCFWDKTKSQYDTSCGAMKDGLKCNAAYYNAALESSPTNNAAYYTDKASVIAKACTSVGKGYWSPADVYTRTQCPAGYRDGTAGVSEAQCTMNVAGGKYVAKANEAVASGTCAAGYAKAAHSVTYGNTSSCAACTGATYAASTGQASCTTCPTAKTYASAVKSYGYWNNGKDGDHTISDGCYATMTGTLSNGSLTEHGCYLGTDGDYGNGGGKRCYVHQDNLKCNAGYYASTLSNGYVWNNTRAGLLGNTCVGVGAGYYSAANILTRNQCPTGLTTIGYGAGADEVTDCGRILHFGDDKLYLRSGKKTTPSLNVKIGDTTYYGNMTAGTGKGKLRLKSGTTTYSVHDDSM